MPAKVVSKDDPEKLGRLRLRFMDQSERLIPDDKLPWTMPEGNTWGGAGIFELGHYFVGQWVEAERMDDLGGTTRINRMISSPGQSGGAEKMVPPVVLDGNKDKAIDKVTPAKGKMEQADDYTTDLSSKSTYKKTTDVNMKFKDLQHIAHAQFDGGNHVLDFIKQFDPNNLSGSVRPAVDIMKKLLESQNPMGALGGVLGGGMYGTLLSMISGLKSQHNSVANPNNGPSQGDPCSLYDTLGNSYEGVLKWKNNINLATGVQSSTLVCFVDPEPPSPPGPLTAVPTALSNAPNTSIGTI
jgi:hypothetical protein